MYSNEYPKEANLVELFEIGGDYYSYAYKRLLEMFPSMQAFVYPASYLTDKEMTVNARTIFNLMLSSFKELLTESEYICAVALMRPEDIKDEYFISETESAPIDDLGKFFGIMKNEVKFSSFAKVVRNRQMQVSRKRMQSVYQK